MNLEYFIAKRLITTKDYKSSISAPIIKIAIAAIALGIIMMIIAVATGVGLQQKIRQKVSAFNGHIIISSYNDNQSDVSTAPISINQNFYPNFKTVDGIMHIQAVASKAGMIKTESAFEGIIFIQQGGYRAQMDRNQRLQNERLNLEYENQLLRMEQRHLSRVTVRLTWVVAIAAVLPSIYAFFQILEYFGYFRTNAIKILYCPFFC